MSISARHNSLNTTHIVQALEQFRMGVSIVYALNPSPWKKLLGGYWHHRRLFAWMYILSTSRLTITRETVSNAVTALSLKKGVPREVLQKPTMFPDGPYVSGVSPPILQSTPSLPTVDPDRLHETTKRNVLTMETHTGVTIDVTYDLREKVLSTTRRVCEPYLDAFPFFADVVIAGCNWGSVVVTIHTPWQFGQECIVRVMTEGTPLMRVPQRMTYGGPTYERFVTFKLPSSVACYLESSELLEHEVVFDFQLSDKSRFVNSVLSAVVHDALPVSHFRLVVSTTLITIDDRCHGLAAGEPSVQSANPSIRQASTVYPSSPCMTPIIEGSDSHPCALSDAVDAMIYEPWLTSGDLGRPFGHPSADFKGIVDPFGDPPDIFCGQWRL